MVSREHPTYDRRTRRPGAERREPRAWYPHRARVHTAPGRRPSRTVWPMSATSRAARAVAGLFIAAVAIGLLAFYLDKGERPTPAPPPVAPGITAHAGTVRTVPNVGRDTRGRTASEIASTLEDLYARAFGRPVDPPATSPSPGPARRVRELLTTGAVAALKKEPDVFDVGELVVTSGSVDFSGVITFVDDEPHDALVQIDFVGSATPIDATEPVVRVHQTGTLGLRRTGERWLVRSFDLRFATRPEPSPSPRL